MNTPLRTFLKASLSPARFRSVQVSWWRVKVYLYSRANASSSKVRPQVTGAESQLTSTIRTINVFERTRICDIMSKYGSDKGNGWHAYTPVYSEIFKELFDKKLKIFELGIGTNNPNLPSTMGMSGRPGASLRGWRECFPSADIFGADIDRNILFSEDRIQTFYCDQLDRAAIHELWANPELRDGADIIIDDGLHTFEANANFLAGSLRYVRDGGFYSVEDIPRHDLESWRKQLPIYAKDFPDFDFALLELPSPINHFDNNLMIAKRRSV